jgi:hypothetical protein
MNRMGTMTQSMQTVSAAASFGRLPFHRLHTTTESGMFSPVDKISGHSLQRFGNPRLLRPPADRDVAKLDTLTFQRDHLLVPE